MLTADAVSLMRKEAASLRGRAREHASRGNLDSSIALCVQALSYVSDCEREQHEDEVRQLERLSATSLAARVDLLRNTH